VSVILDPKQSSLPNGSTVATIFQFGGPTQKFPIGSDRVVYKEGEFIVKVQGGLYGTSPLLIYDREKSFQLTIDNKTGPGLQVANFTATHRTVPGSPYLASVKSFLYARTESKGVRVFIDKLAPWQTW
jgi:hypothetical protein